MLPSKSIRDRLDQLIRTSKKDDYSSVSVLIGKNHAYIQQFIRRGNPQRLKEEDRRILARHFNVPEWELGGPFEEAIRPKYAPGFSEGTSENIVLIPTYDIRASAGYGAFVDREWTDEFMPFQTQFLKKLTSTAPDSLAVLNVSGDSMHPTLADGDKILVDTHEKEIARDGIFVIRNGDALNVKRISMNPAKGKLTVKSDNPLYETWKDCNPEDIHIIGQVIWAGRNL